MEQSAIEKEVARIADQIVKRYGPQRVILFGSVGRGEYDSASDLDFLIIKDDVPFYGIDRIRELDELIDRDMAADMLVYTSDEFEERLRLRDPFISAIANEGRVLHG